VIQVEIVCREHNRALTPSKAPTSPFGRGWAIYNITAECEVGKEDCITSWYVMVNNRVIGSVIQGANDRA
jgi:hypothetical protein